MKVVAQPFTEAKSQTKQSVSKDKHKPAYCLVLVHHIFQIKLDFLNESCILNKAMDVFM